ncbi:MAG TPA: nickel pincer cofactor biosynthesis protein LarB [Planctomycetaceae bacterium]|nr:nickel pincer cofactor biosynthesis protein LarB [Planctomycetaceae bacterium]
MSSQENDADELLRWADDRGLSWSELAEKVLARGLASSSHRPDLDRHRRCGFREVIYGEGKSASDVVEIAGQLLSTSSASQDPSAEVLVTRFSADLAEEVQPNFAFSRYDSQARTLRLSADHSPASELLETSGGPALPRSHVAVVTAGSTDLPVALEAVETLHWMHVPVTLTTDVGVAGPYRLLPHLPHLRRACALIVIAGMEGALASVVGGLVASPVIAVPTSVGYGSNFEGITTLLSMMSSCAAGVTTVNIDGGFKGGYIAGLISAGLNPDD